MQATESRAQTRGFGVFELDVRAAELRKRGVRIKLQEQPFQILCLLLDHSGEVVTREELRQKLWPAHTFVDFDRSLNKAMTKLRSALGDSAESPRYVETVPRHGYRFLAPVHDHHEGAETATFSVNPSAVGHTAIPPGEGEERSLFQRFLSSLDLHTRSGRRRNAVLAAAFAFVILAAFTYMRIQASSSRAGLSSGSNLRQSVAVVGFKNLSGDTKEAWLSTALSDWLMTELTAGEHVRAIPAESVARMKMELALPDLDSLSPESLTRIRNNLGTDFVVVGSYALLGAKANGQIRLDLRLQAFHTLRARDLLQSAIAAESTFALSHAALATAWANLGYDENAKAEAKKAFELSSNLSRAERLLVEGRYHETSRNWDKAAEIYRALFEFFPDNLDYGLALANAEYRANKWKDTLTTIAALRELPAPLRDDPRIDLAEQDAARSLGDTKRSEAALTRAAEKAQAAGASLLLAMTRLHQAWLFENLGRFSEVEAAVREAKQLYIAANNRGGVAEATTIGAIGLKNQGDYLGAERGYEEVLVLYRQIGNRTGLAAENDNIGDILVYLGDLEGARRGYEAALAIYHEVGDQNGEALAKNGLGDVFLALGDHRRAMEMFEGSLDICSRIGNRGRQAGALAGKARVHRLQQDLAQALKEETEARAIFAEIGDKTEVAHVDLHLAELFLDEGKSEQAAVSARRAADVFEKTKGTSDEASANLLLARTLLVDGRIADARKIVDQVKGVAAATHNRELELSAALTAARVRAASGSSSETDDSLQRLDRVITDASTTRFEEIALEARLAKGEIEMGTTDSSVGRAYLEALRKDAANGGFQLIAQKASAALQTGRSRPPHGVVN